MDEIEFAQAYTKAIKSAMDVKDSQTAAALMQVLALIDALSTRMSGEDDEEEEEEEDE